MKWMNIDTGLSPEADFILLAIKDNYLLAYKEDGQYFVAECDCGEPVTNCKTIKIDPITHWMDIDPVPARPKCTLCKVDFKVGQKVYRKYIYKDDCSIGNVLLESYEERQKRIKSIIAADYCQNCAPRINNEMDLS